MLKLFLKKRQTLHRSASGFFYYSVVLLVVVVVFSVVVPVVAVVFSPVVVVVVAAVVSVVPVVVVETSTVPVVSVFVLTSDTASGSMVHVPYVVATTRAPPTRATLTFQLASNDFNQSIFYCQNKTPLSTFAMRSWLGFIFTAISLRGP